MRIEYGLDIFVDLQANSVLSPQPKDAALDAVVQMIESEPRNYNPNFRTRTEKRVEIRTKKSTKTRNSYEIGSLL